MWRDMLLFYSNMIYVKITIQRQSQRQYRLFLKVIFHVTKENMKEILENKFKTYQFEIIQSNSE